MVEEKRSRSNEITAEVHAAFKKKLEIFRAWQYFIKERRRTKMLSHKVRLLHLRCFSNERLHFFSERAWRPLLLLLLILASFFLEVDDDFRVSDCCCFLLFSDVVVGGVFFGFRNSRASF